MVLCKNIFLVEDNDDERILFIKAIKEINSYIKYTVAYNDKDALTKLRILKHLPDLIILDINFPGLNGFEFLKYIKTNVLFNFIPVIVISASGNVVEEVYKAGADGFIKKPVLVSKLYSEIEYVFNSMKEII